MRFWLSILLALALMGCSGGSASKDLTIVVDEGSSLWAAARKLEKQGALDSASGFVRYAQVFGGTDIRPGEYAIKKGMSGREILELMIEGKTVQRLVAIPEGMPSILVWERLMAEKRLTGEIPVPAEGSILPDSYAVEVGETRAAVVKRMQSAMTKAIAELWEDRQATAVVKTPEEAVNLAAIVEKETGKADERPMVAGVLSNRIRIGMMLGADATTIYPITKGKPLGRLIRVSDLRDRNPYNTRIITGLPAGPITNPGRDAIAAVLNPAKTDALFYVADGTGGHVFSRTLAEHNANAARWKALRRERGEM
jgi:UPF0755 protein